MCLNYAEIIMMTLVALSVLVAMIVLISNLVLFQRLNNYRNCIKTLRVDSDLDLDLIWRGLYGSWNKHFDIEKRSFIETQNNAENQSNDQDDEQNNDPPAIND